MSATPLSIPLSSLLRTVIDRVQNATSSQLGLLLETERAIAVRRRKIEQSRTATVIAPRPDPGEVRPRERSPPPLLQPPASQCRRSRKSVASRPQFGMITDIAGHASESGFDDGPALLARFHGLVGMVKPGDGTLIVVDCWNDRIRCLKNGIVTTFAGGEENEPRDGPAQPDAQFNFSSSVALDKKCLLVTDENHRRVRAITLEGAMSRIGGVDGPWLEGEPRAVTVARDGTVFVSVVRFGEFDKLCILSCTGTTTALAGGAPGFADGRGESAAFRGPNGMATGSDGRLYVADTGNHSIRCVDRDGHVRTVAGRPWDRGEERASIDGDVTTARFNHPAAVAVASDGTIYVGEYKGKRVRQIRDGVVSVVYKTEGPANGLLLDEAEGLLYVATDTQISTVFVGTTLQHLLTRVDPVMRTWCLVQRERATITLAAVAEDAQMARARTALRLLMHCPLVDITFRVCSFAF